MQQTITQASQVAVASTVKAFMGVYTDSLERATVAKGTRHIAPSPEWMAPALAEILLRSPVPDPPRYEENYRYSTLLACYMEVAKRKFANIELGYRDIHCITILAMQTISQLRSCYWVTAAETLRELRMAIL